MEGILIVTLMLGAALVVGLILENTIRPIGRIRERLLDKAEDAAEDAL